MSLYVDIEKRLGAFRLQSKFEVADETLALLGASGCGKSMICSRLPSIMPDMTPDEIIETTKIYSIVHALSREEPVMDHRPFRSPHHTISDVALIGGGSSCLPGEISLAHNGVLFLDELPEFSRSALETRRQPLED